MEDARYLTVPKAIRFQQEQDWAEARSECHRLAVETWTRINDPKGLPPLHSDPETWFAQMTVSTLPGDTDIATLKQRLYDEHRIEMPLIDRRGEQIAASLRPGI